MALTDGVTGLSAANVPHKSGTDTVTGQWAFTKPVATPGGINFTKNGDMEAWYDGAALSPPEPDSPEETFTFGDKSVHFDLLELRVRDQKFPLTLMEANVLRYLIQHEGKPVSRKKMLEAVWGLHEDTDTRAIDNFIVRLRRYIEDEPTRPRHVLTVRGVGYRFVASPPQTS